MRYKRILLVSLMYPTGINTLSAQPPSGLGYIAQALEGKVDYEVLDLSLGYKNTHLIKKIEEFHPDAIGISMMTFNYKTSYRLMGMIKERFPNISIIVGGPHLSTLREKVLEDCPAIDYGVVMEGENTLQELCLGKEIEDIKGLIYRKEDKIHYNGDTFIQDLDSLSFPRYERFELPQYLVKRMKIVTSRGCPYQCIYCPVESAIGNRFRARSPESVIEEISYWITKGYNEFDIVDDNFTLSKERVHRICELIEKNRFKIKLHCPNGLRADRVDKDLLTRMKNVGFDTIAFGVEAGNNRILEILEKGERIEDIEKAIEVACRLGFKVMLFFIIGSPYETIQDINDSMTLAKKYPIYEARFYNLIPFPNTRLYQWVEENRYFLRSADEYLNDASHFDNNPCFETPELPLIQRKEAFRRASVLARQIKIDALSRRLYKYGPIGSIIALLFMSELFRVIYQQNRFLRKAAEFIKVRI